ncbi:MAG: hypothetical protein K0V04_05295 [Deltaproteobacteria bacterium]|nr:hypothetical protein [Deltaproteobacteria bacterium]
MLTACAGDDAATGADPFTGGADDALPGGTAGSSLDTSGDSSASGPGSETSADSTGDDQPPPSGTRAAGVVVQAVEANQAVMIDLVVDRQPIAPPGRVAPVISGRPMLVRAMYSLEADFAPRVLQGRLWLHYADDTNAVYEDERMVSGPADPTQLDGTFGWVVDAQDVTPDVEYRVEILEVSESPGDPGPVTAGYPDAGFEPLTPWADTMNLEVMLVPFSCPGFGEVEITPEDLADFEAYLFNTYPVQQLQVEVHEVVDSPSCDEFDAAETILPALREQEGAAPWVYYGGLLPGDGGGYSIAIGDSDQMDFRRTFANHTWRWYGLTFDLFAHELGHNHGREHTFEDGQYPHDNFGPCGARAVAGWGVSPGLMPNTGYSNDLDLGLAWIDPHAQLVPPTDPTCDGLPNANEGSFNDFMSYAYPYWVSAYTYAALADRVQLISSWRNAADEGRRPGSTMRLVVSPEGQLHRVDRAGAWVAGPDDELAWCGAGDLRAAVPMRRGRAIADERRADGSLRAHHYETIEVALAADDPWMWCEVDVRGRAYRLDR